MGAEDAFCSRNCHGVVPGSTGMKIAPVIVEVAEAGSSSSRPPVVRRTPSSVGVKKKLATVFPIAMVPLTPSAPKHEADPESTRCLICLDNPDDYAAPGREVGMCYKCGQSYCSSCRPLLESKLQKCPNCRASLFVPLSVSMQRLKDLIKNRPEGRHVGPSMNNLGFMYEQGWGCEADAVAAVEWYERAADCGLAQA